MARFSIGFLSGLDLKMRSLRKGIYDSVDKRIVKKFIDTWLVNLRLMEDMVPQASLTAKLKKAYLGNSKHALLRNHGYMFGKKRSSRNSIAYGIYSDQVYEPDARFGNFASRKVATIAKMLDRGSMVLVDSFTLNIMSELYKSATGKSLGFKNTKTDLRVIIPSRPFISTTVADTKREALSDLKSIVLEEIKKEFKSGSKIVREFRI